MTYELTTMDLVILAVSLFIVLCFLNVWYKERDHEKDEETD